MSGHHTRDELSAENLAYLKSCQLVAIENLDFYTGVYAITESDLEREILGRVLAQKKECVQAIDAILNGSANEPTSIGPVEAHPFILDFPNRTPLSKDFNNFWSLSLSHEKQFHKILNIALKQIDDERTCNVLEHHLKAAEIALNALTTTDMELNRVDID